MERRFKYLGNQTRRTVYGQWCLYCGEPASCRDHFPPASHSTVGVLFPSCLECNLLAGTHHPQDLVSRTRYVRGAIAKRYRKVLETPEWSREEINELGLNLQTGVKIWQTKREKTLKRLAWNAESYLQDIDETTYSALIVAGHNATTAIEKEKFWNFDAKFKAPTRKPNQNDNPIISEQKCKQCNGAFRSRFKKRYCSHTCQRAYERKYQKRYHRKNLARSQ